MVTVSFNPCIETAFFFGYSTFDHINNTADQLTLEACTAICICISIFILQTKLTIFFTEKRSNEVSVLLGRYALV